MKIKHISTSLATAFLIFNATAGASSVTCTPYAGLAVSWDQMKGKRFESFTNSEDDILVFSRGRSLSADRINGYIFVGVDFDSKHWPLFISPEFQIGQGGLSSRRNNTAPDPQFRLLNGQLLQRPLDAKLSRTLSMSFVLRAGKNLTQSSRLYALGGLDVSRFKYTYTFVSLNLEDAIPQGHQTFKHARWKSAPVLGLGVEKKLNQVRVGLEYRVAFYNTSKGSDTIPNDGEIETVTAKLKPRVSSLTLKLAYSF